MWFVMSELYEAPSALGTEFVNGRKELKERHDSSSAFDETVIAHAVNINGPPLCPTDPLAAMGRLLQSAHSNASNIPGLAINDVPSWQIDRALDSTRNILDTIMSIINNCDDDDLHPEHKEHFTEEVARIKEMLSPSSGANQSNDNLARVSAAATAAATALGALLSNLSGLSPQFSY
jgi:hypothetical protein